MKDYRESERSRGPLLAVALVVVAILLAVSVFLLMDTEIRKEGARASSGNSITSAPTDLISLAEKNEGGDVRFQVSNMFPGDSASKHIYIGVKDKGVRAISFSATVTSQINRFSEAMGFAVEVNDVPLYDGKLSELPQFLRVEFGENPGKLDYKITFYLDTSVGNEVQGASMSLDFDWWIAPGDYVPYEDKAPEPSLPPEEPPKPELTIDLTDCVPWCVGWCPWCPLLPLAVLALIGLLILLIVFLAGLFKKRERKEEKPPQPKPEIAPPKPVPPPAPPKKPAPQGGGGYAWAVLFGTLSIGSSMALSSILKQTHKVKKPKPPKKKKK